jgi:hypothetical protein
VEKYGRAGQATDEIRRMRIACWIPKVTKHTLTICSTYYFFHGNIGYMNAPQYCDLQALPVSFLSEIISYVRAEKNQNLSGVH